MLRIDGDVIVLPGLTTAHSHAFQRGMRGRAQRPVKGEDDFWSWREAMYDLAGSLEPESIHRLSRLAYRELHRAGVRTVGEFHYVHHQCDGTPYDDRTLLAEAVIQAARDEGLRICLLRVVYQRAGPNRPAEGVQRRFSDARLEDAFRDVEELARRYAGERAVRIGIAPHSVRAVPPAWLGPIAAFAEQLALPIHMHVAEQPAEIEICQGETGRTPVTLLADHGVLSERFVAVHATHLAEGEAARLGAAGSMVCLCPTTERDLGDGLPDLGALEAAGVRLCVGVDSHVLTAPLEDLRGIELGERLRTGRRTRLSPARGTPAEALWRIGSSEGDSACGFEEPGPLIRLDRAAQELTLVDDDQLLDAVIFSGTDRLFLPS